MPPLPKAIFLGNHIKEMPESGKNFLSYEPDDNYLLAIHEQCQQGEFAGNYFVPSRNGWVLGVLPKASKH